MCTFPPVKEMKHSANPSPPAPEKPPQATPSVNPLEKTEAGEQPGFKCLHYGDTDR